MESIRFFGSYDFFSGKRLPAKLATLMFPANSKLRPVATGLAALLLLLINGCATSSPSKWTALFDGRSLAGWTQRGGKAQYRVVQGEIVGTTVDGEPNSFLCTTRDFSDFILELEFNVDEGLNSGVQIRSQAFDGPTEFQWEGKTYKVPAARVHGLQVEIDPSTRAWTAGIQEEGGRAWLNDLKNNPPAREAFHHLAWNKLRIECRGSSIRTWLNDVPAADLRDERVLSGFIALQVHGIGKGQPPLNVRFRNIRIEEMASGKI
jgi:hypothetical protein